ncbi:hypothetical protein BDW22DRAFT_1354877 [Trametopsis cervina]|nr:hypothetical protein BDW22DRAFT_1354877 [Trametopsis cervina]
MNFLDAYDITGPSVTPPPREGPEPTLNEEVTQVVGQLSRFWGGFRKQSQSVFETARKDLGQVVSQAQKEITKLTAEPSSSETATTVEEVEGETVANPSDVPEAGPSLEGTRSATEDSETSPSKKTHNRNISVSAAAQNIFSRLQSSLPADLASTVQSKLPESIKQGAGSIDFGQLRTTLASEFQRVQDITRQQAEEYAHKSEELLRDAGEFLKDAVKVVPPEEEGAAATPGVLWDGSDIWTLPEISAPSTTDSKGKGKAKGSSDQSSAEGLRAVATRAEALLKQLKQDPEVIRADPEADERAAKLWKEWHGKEIEAKEGGIESPEWQSAVKVALADPVDGGALQKTMETLVPSTLSHETFWTRYFFRVHQVESEEQRRKALLQGTVESEEDIDWESDDEETVDKAATPSAPAVNLAESTKTLTAIKSEAVTELSGTPSRISSEDSYDVVSSQVSNAGDSKTEEASEDDDDEEGDDDEEEEDDDEEEEDEDDSEEDEEDEEEEEEEEEGPEAKSKPTQPKVPKPSASQKKGGSDEEDSDWE